MSQADAMTRAQRGTAADQARADPRARWMIHAAAGAIACASLVPSAMPAHAQAQGQAASSAVAVPIDIASQPLAEALMQLARQTNVDISAPSRVTRGRTAPAVSGTLTVPQALARLLAGTPLSARALRANAYVVEAPGESLAAGGGGRAGNGDRGGDGVLLTQRPSRSKWASRFSGEGEAGGAAADSESAGGYADSATSEILVLGRRSLNVDIRRSENGSQPYVVFDSARIERSQAANLEDFLTRNLPMNQSGFQFGQQANPVSGNRSTISLRGLDPTQTLILVDGRRLPSVVSNGNLGQPDINGIPLAAIDRIEILPSTAGGIYGGGAVGGVINIILKRDYNGVTLALGGGISSRGDATRGRVDLSGSFNLEGGRTNIVFSGSVTRSEALTVGQRSFASRARALLFRNSPNTINGAFQPPYGSTSNLCAGTFSCSGSPLVLDDGTPLGFSFASVPIGYAGPASDGGRAFLSTAGRYNLELPDDAVNGAGIPLLPSTRSASVNASVRRRFTSWLELFADASYLQNNSIFPIGPSLVARIPANAANNPFTADVLVSVPLNDLDFEGISYSSSVRFTGGLIAQLPFGWTGNADYTWGQSEISYDTVPFPLVSDTTAALNNGVSVNGRAALDVLRDMNAFPLNFGAYLKANPPHATGGEVRSRSEVFSLRLSGPLVRLPGGVASATVLAERRQDRTLPYILETPLATDVVNRNFIPGSRVRNDALYAEIRIPLVSAENQLAGIHRLEPSIATRIDRYYTRAARIDPLPLVPNGTPPTFTSISNEASQASYTASLLYAPFPQLVFRGSYSTGFLQPPLQSLTPLYLTIPGTRLGFNDPLRGNTPIGATGPWQLNFGGNPTLRPETSRSYSLGVVATPIRNLRLSIDYTRISKSNEIFGLPAEFLLANASLFPDYVTRGTNLPGDQPGWPGPIIAVGSSRYNIDRTSIEALDLRADYGLSVTAEDRLDFSLIATRQLKFERQPGVGSAILDSVGNRGGILPWRANGSLTWSHGPLVVTWSVQYFDSYRVVTTGASTGAIQQAIVQQGRLWLSSQIYNDLFIRYTFPQRAGNPLNGFQIDIGVENVFDTQPPVFAQTLPLGASSFFGDPRLRRISFAVT